MDNYIMLCVFTMGVLLFCMAGAFICETFLDG